MALEDITREVRAFITTHILSVEALEVLLLLHRERERVWTADEVQEVICSSVPSITAKLEHFATIGTLTVKQGSPRTYQYRAASPEREAQITGLAEAYRSRRVSVLQLIYADRSDDLRAFSDAFKISR